MPRVLLVSGLEMKGIPAGRSQRGSTILYTGNFTQTVPEEEMSADVKNVDEAYIHMANPALRESTQKLVHQLQEAGKKVNIFTCECDVSAKHQAVTRMGITSIVWSECGGQSTFRQLVAQFA